MRWIVQKWFCHKILMLETMLEWSHLSAGKKSACNAGDLGSTPRLGRSPEEGNGNPFPVFLPGKSHGQRSLAGYSSWGCRVRHEWVTNFRLHHACIGVSELLTSIPTVWRADFFNESQCFSTIPFTLTLQTPIILTFI